MTPAWIGRVTPPALLIGRDTGSEHLRTAPTHRFDHMQRPQTTTCRSVTDISIQVTLPPEVDAPSHRALQVLETKQHTIARRAF